MDDETKLQIEYQYQVYSSGQGLIPLADAKAGAIIGANLALIATLANAPFFMDKFYKIANLPAPQGTVISVFVLFCVFTLVSILCSLMVLYPRPSNTISKLRPPHLTYFEHILKKQSADRYLSAVKDLEPEAVLHEMCSQNFEIAKILSQKYSISKLSMGTFIISMASWLLLLYQVFKYQL
ncbi:MAG TPA: DUF5706 domain-containing protein [Candidatus Wallbacteria bacterium]|nr:DUF5706 domain-containing protein [Candidatus Wallbacteria bacterium]